MPPSLDMPPVDQLFSNTADLEATNQILETYAGHILEATACTLCHIRDVNDWKSEKPASYEFVGKDLPDMGVVEYCQRLHKYFRCSPAVSLHALIYIDRFVNLSDVTINKLTIHRLLCVANIIAVKYWEDLHYSNSYYAQVGGIDLHEINRLEALMMHRLNWDLNISPEEFKQYFHELVMHSSVCTNCHSSPAIDAADKTPVHAANKTPTGESTKSTIPEARKFDHNNAKNEDSDKVEEQYTNQHSDTDTDTDKSSVVFDRASVVEYDSLFASMAVCS